jgi:hypothetical protein
MTVPPVYRAPLPPPPSGPPPGWNGQPQFLSPTTPRPRPAWLSRAATIGLTALISIAGTLYVTHQNASKQFTLSQEPGTPAQNGDGSQAAMKNDLKTASIAEQSFATDNSGAFVADIVEGGSQDPLVAQGLTLAPGDSLTATLFTVTSTNDSYCLTVTSIDTPTVWYLSSVDDVPTLIKPTGC